MENIKVDDLVRLIFYGIFLLMLCIYDRNWPCIKSVVCICSHYQLPSYLWYQRLLRRNQIIDHSDVDGASPVGAAPTTYSFPT